VKTAEKKEIIIKRVREIAVSATTIPLSIFTNIFHQRFSKHVYLESTLEILQQFYIAMNSDNERYCVIPGDLCNYRRIRGISITWHKQYYAKGVHRPWSHSYFDSYSCAKTSPEHNVHLPVYKTIPPICGSSLERLGFKRYHRQPDITTLLCFC
jgi:hypothetical protein